MGSALWYELLGGLLAIMFLVFSYLRGKADAVREHVAGWLRPTLEAMVVLGSLILASVAVYTRHLSFHLMDEHDALATGMLLNSVSVILIPAACCLGLAGSLYVVCKPAVDIKVASSALWLPDIAEYIHRQIHLMDRDE